MVERENKITIIMVFFLLVVFLMQIKVYIEETHTALYERLEERAVKSMQEVAFNIDESLRYKVSGDLLERLKEDSWLREDLERDLRLFITSEVQYAYIIYKDEKNRFRFLADGSAHDKARLHQKLDVSEEYLYIYTTKKDITLSQSILEKLSITYVYPIVRDNRVEALIVFDFSSTLVVELQKILEPIKILFLLIYMMIGFFVFIATLQAFYYYKVRKKGFTDPLTQIYNRQYLRHIWDKIDMNKYHIMMIDFDYFKKINDSYGHGVGDSVLYEGAKVMKNILHKEDIIFRYGGEEFLVLLKKESTIISQKVANTIRVAIYKHIILKDRIRINLSVSIGLNVNPEENRNFNDAIKVADMMLYRAKANGRNCVVTNNKSDVLYIEEKYTTGKVIDSVKSAIEDNRILCYFQRIVDLNKKIYKYEALVRYVNEDGKLVNPNHFLAEIMHTSVYVDLVKRIIDICTDTALSKSMAISINLSIHDLLNLDLMDYFRSKLDDMGDASSLISIEILEHDDFLNIYILQSVLKSFKNYGIKFAMDDFGSGYANFTYLAKLDIDYIKIDGSLIQDIFKSENTKHIVKSIIDLAHQMNMKTIAEYVSSEAIYTEMSKMGIDYVQGYYISRPKRLEDI